MKRDDAGYMYSIWYTQQKMAQINTFLTENINHCQRTVIQKLRRDASVECATCTPVTKQLGSTKIRLQRRQIIIG